MTRSPFWHARSFTNFPADADARPWCLTVSFSHPHDPYVARRKYWDLYEQLPASGSRGCRPLPMTTTTPIRAGFSIPATGANSTSPNTTLPARDGPISPIFSYLDEKHRRTARNAQPSTRQLDRTAILFCSDHGDMLGERGLWFKMHFFEGSARTPLLLSRARAGRRFGRRTGFQSRYPADALRVRRHRHRQRRAMVRRRKPDADCGGKSPHAGRCRSNMPPKPRSRRWSACAKDR